jgi:hypothetical protein
MVTSVSKGGTQKLPKNLRLSKRTDMTIHWKALEEHFLMVLFVFRCNQIQIITVKFVTGGWVMVHSLEGGKEKKKGN